MHYLFPKNLTYLHKRIAAVSGGDIGVRDYGLLESAAFRPQATFDGRDLFPDLFAKAAALGHGIIANHPFVDGNKRVGFEAARLMLRLNGHDIKASPDEKYEIVMAMAEGKIREDKFADWLRTHAVPYRPE